MPDLQAAPSTPAARALASGRQALLALVAPFALGVFASPLAQAQATEAAPAFAERPCDIEAASPEIAARLRCGTVRVLRNPAQAEAGHIDIAVAIKRSAAPVPGLPPVLLLHGGPGGSYTPVMGRGATDISTGRDTIAFDMRGGGRTGPTLCKALPGAFAEAHRLLLQGTNAQAEQDSALAACVAEFAAAKVRPEHFGTDRNVEDAEAVRRALGIPRWSVFGMSYGTTVAAEYLARHPGVIDAVVLDSLYPPDEFVPSVRLAQSRAIAQMLGECRADAACQARFPKLNPEAATRALAELDTQPLPFQLQGLRLTATEATVRGALHSLMYTEATARSVPWFLDAVVRRDGDTIAATLGQTLLAGDLVSRSDTSVSGLLGTDCRDRPRHHAPLVAGEGPTWMSLFNGLPHGACKAWPLGTPPGLPKGTSVPVLILSGAYDGFQIDANAVANAIGPAAQVVQIPHAAHTVIGAGKCPRSLVSNFIAAPKAVLNTSCMASMSAPPFLLDARPQPAAVALGARLQGSTPPPAALLAALGLICWLLAGLVLPVLRALGRRLRPAAFAPAAHPPVRGLWLAAMGAGFLSAVGLIAPLAGTVALNPGAATFGLDAGLAHVLWAWVAGGALALGVQMAALRRQQWLIAVAALGAVLMAVGALALGLAPWA